MVAVLQRRGPYIYSDDGQEPVTPIYRRTTRRPGDEELLDNLAHTSGRGAKPVKAQQRRITHAPDTYEDGEIAPSTRSGYQQQSTRHQGHRTAVWLILGMVLMLILWSIGVHLWVWWMNAFYDPGYYMQTAHRDMVIVTNTQGTPFQVRAFVDAQNHIALLVVPNGDTAHSHTVVGLVLSIDDPQHQATLSVSANGTTVSVLAQGPLIADWFTTHQQSEQWSADISQRQSGG